MTEKEKKTAAEQKQREMEEMMAQIGVAFSNAGFMGFPLVTAVLGGEAVFYAAGFVALLNALQWTYG